MLIALLHMAIDPSVSSYNLLVYVLIFILHAIAFKLKSLKFFSEYGWAKKPRFLFFLKTVGIIFWMLIPIGMMGIKQAIDLFSGKFQISQVHLAIIACLIILAIITGRSQVKRMLQLLRKTQGLHKDSLNLTYIPLRIFFLIAYEFWFRGIFLFSLMSYLGTNWAIVVNVSFYALLHAFAGKKEFLGSILFGIILCLISIWTQSVWPAAVIHLALSLSYEVPVLLAKKKTA